MPKKGKKTLKKKQAVEAIFSLILASLFTNTTTEKEMIENQKKRNKEERRKTFKKNHLTLILFLTNQKPFHKETSLSSY